MYQCIEHSSSPLGSGWGTIKLDWKLPTNSQPESNIFKSNQDAPSPLVARCFSLSICLQVRTSDSVTTTKQIWTQIEAETSVLHRLCLLIRVCEVVLLDKLRPGMTISLSESELWVARSCISLHPEGLCSVFFFNCSCSWFTA